MNRRKFLLGTALAAIASTVRPKRDPTPSVASTMTFAQAKRARPVWRKDAKPQDWCVLVDELGPELTIEEVRREIKDGMPRTTYAAWLNGTDPTTHGVIYDVGFISTLKGNQPRLVRFPCCGVHNGEWIKTKGHDCTPEVIDL